MNIKKLILISLLLFTSAAYCIQPFKVSDIKVTGLQRVSLGAVLLAIPVRVGSSMNDQHVSEVIKSLFATGDFDDVQVSNNGSILLINVQERPTIASITFSGNKAIEKDKLQKNLDAAKLVVGEPLDRPVLQQLSQALEDFYYSTGHYRAKVQSVVTPLPRNRVDVKFVFTEGPSAEIQQLNFIGNKDFDAATLRSQFTLESTHSAWWKFWSKKEYQKQVLAGDLKKLEAFYVNNGYLKFHVTGVQVSISPDKGGVYINITLSEGKQYKLKEVQFRGDRSENGLSPSELERFKTLVKFYPDEIYNGAKITALEEAVKYELGNTGFAYPDVKSVPIYDEKSNEVTLVVNITKGGRVYVREVKFEGNSKTKDSVLRREMRQFEGTWLNSSSVETGKRRLNRTGFFEDVKVDTVRVPNADGQVDVIYKVTETNTGSLNFSVGYGTESGASIQAGIQQKNFLGTGNEVGFSVMRDEYQQSASFNYKDPYFTPNGVSFGTQLYYTYYRGNQNYVVDYKNDSYGIGFTWGWPLTENLYTEVGVGYRVNKLKDFMQDNYYYQLNRFLALHDDLPVTNDGGITYTSTTNDIKLQDYPLTWRLIYNTLNNASFPTSGNNQRFNITVTTPGSDSTYYKAQYDLRQYFPLNRAQNFSLLVRGRLGYAHGYGARNGVDEQVPFYDNFYLGGNSTIRGFSTNALGPKAVYCNPGQCVTNGGQDSNNAVGGNATAILSAELFFPLPFGDVVNRQVRTSFFVDAGSLWDTTYALDTNKVRPYGDQEVQDYSDPKNIRASAGLSVQWISPLGPLVFALARPIKSYKGDDKQVFSFNIGTSF